MKSIKKAPEATGASKANNTDKRIINPLILQKYEI